MDSKDMSYTSRAFALSLIGILSIYLLLMILRAVRQKQNLIVADGSSEVESNYEYDYYYGSQSYDFAPYRSLGTDAGHQDLKGFAYNKTIKDHTSAIAAEDCHFRS